LKTPSSHRSGRRCRLKQSAITTSLVHCHAVVIGTGSLGRQVAILLASLGVKHMSLYDPDIVTAKNLAQGFMEFDVGMPKVDAVANSAHQQNPRMELLTYGSRFRRHHLQKWRSGLKYAVFLCVDSMTARKSSWRLIKQAARFLCDGRPGPDVIKVLASEMPATDTNYPSTLRASKQSPLGKSSCDIVTAIIAAGLMVAQFSRWLRDLPIIPDQVFNLLA